MKIAVIGGTGLIGRKLCDRLDQHGHEAVVAAPQTGVNTLTGEGLAEAVSGATAVVDVSNSPSVDGPAALDFFMTSTDNILRAADAAGVEHYVALSVVGTQRLLESGYFRAKSAQEELIGESGIPSSIVHATQFFEFLDRMADDATEGETVRVAPVLVQPISADDVALAVARTSLGAPVHGIAEVAGPEVFSLEEVIADALRAGNDPRHVVADPGARYFGATVGRHTLLPGNDAVLGSTTLADWRANAARAA
jgi:uncharacterized protein YbjT (DUF2867 family)